MKSPSRIVPLLLAAVLGGAGSFVATHAGAARAVDAPPQTVTVFVDATFGFRKKHMATQLTRSHAEYAAKGYRFAAMSPYNENGDLVGFFVTYVRNP